VDNHWRNASLYGFCGKFYDCEQPGGEMLGCSSRRGRDTDTSHLYMSARRQVAVPWCVRIVVNILGAALLVLMLVAGCRIDFDVIAVPDGVRDTPLDAVASDSATVDASFGICAVGNGNGMCPGVCMGDTCVIDCAGAGSCLLPVACPAGVPCEIRCGTGACGDIDCGNARRCLIECSGDGSCPGAINCGDGGPCDLACTGTGSCAGPVTVGTFALIGNCSGAGSCPSIECSAACACDVTCALGACSSAPVCPTSCTSSTGCSSSPPCLPSC